MVVNQKQCTTCLLLIYISSEWLGITITYIIQQWCHMEMLFQQSLNISLRVTHTELLIHLLLSRIHSRTPSCATVINEMENTSTHLQRHKENSAFFMLLRAASYLFNTSLSVPHQYIVGLSVVLLGTVVRANSPLNCSTLYISSKRCQKECRILTKYRSTIQNRVQALNKQESLQNLKVTISFTIYCGFKHIHTHNMNTALV